MKKIISAALAVLCALSVFTACGNSGGTSTETEQSASAEEQSTDCVIRNVKWGMTIDEVKAVETAELESEKEDKSLRYKNIDMFGQKFDLVYSFSYARGLETAAYASPNLLEREAEELEKSIINALNEKYGKGEAGSPLYELVWYSNGTKIGLSKFVPEESANLTFFVIRYEKDENLAQKSDNGNL